MTDLFTEFSTGMLDNGSPIPERLSGCKVVSKVSSNRSQDTIDVCPDTLVSEIINIGIYIHRKMILSLILLLRDLHIFIPYLTRNHLILKPFQMQDIYKLGNVN